MVSPSQLLERREKMESERLTKTDALKGVTALGFFVLYALLYAFVFGFGGLMHMVIGGVGSLIFVALIGGKFWSWLEVHIDED